MSDDKLNSSTRRVEWDEENLAKNAEYQRLHPVTMRIDEPKTPFVYIDDDVAAAMDSEEAPTWDPKVNALAREVKEKVEDDRTDAPVAPISQSGRPMLHVGTVSGELEEEERERKFKKMRSAVYADEGAKFKALLAKQRAEEEEEDDEDEDGEEEASEGLSAPAKKGRTDAPKGILKHAKPMEEDVVQMPRVSKEDREKHKVITRIM